MKLEEFKCVVDEVLTECLEIMDSKGVAYSGMDDKFGNFNRIAGLLNLDRTEVWSVYFHKHIDAIDAYIRGEYEDSESIYGRIMDAINYLLLLYGMITERGDTCKVLKDTDEKV